jgi:NAD/NADP transhydrogenase beta subunit
MFSAQRRGLTADEHSTSPLLVVISLLNTYAGLSTAVAGFVLDKTAMVIAGVILVGSGSVLVSVMAKAMNQQEGQQ